LTASYSFGQKQRCIHEGTHSKFYSNSVFETEKRSAESICIVFHIITNENEEDIPDDRIISQLERINKDFQAINLDLPLIPSLFQESIGNADFNFVLAQEDPDGIPHTGIVRKKTELENIGSLISVDGKEVIKYSTLGGSDAWYPDACINVWVGTTTDVFGITAPLDLIGTQDDGIIITPEAFGQIGNRSESATALGRTLTHELGHYFGLSHLWGSRRGCNTGDGIDDTPEQEGPYTGCPDFPQITCGSADMFNNFMEFSNDECLLFFTEGQVNQMRTVLEEDRSGIMVSTTDLPPGSDISFEIRQSDTGLAILHENKTSNFANVSIYTTSGQLILNEQLNSINVHLINTNNWPRAV